MKLQSVDLKLDGSPIFRGLDLSISATKAAVIGANGSGKTALLKLLRGLYKADSGQVVSSSRPGMVLQSPDHQILFPTVREELGFGLMQQGLAQEQINAKIEQLAISHGMGFALDRACESLSLGQRQLLCILAILADEPDCLLLDEPFASLDERTGRRINTLLLSLPIPVLVATHQLDMAIEFQEVIWLDQGSLHMQGDPSTVLAAYREWSMDCEAI